MLQGERAAFTALGAFGKALGLSMEKLHAAEPLPGAFAYSAYVNWLATYGTPAEFVGAFLVNLAAWGENCGRISRALQAGYGLSGQDVAFFDLFAGAPPGFEEQGLAVVEEGLAQGADRITSYNVCYTKLLRDDEQQSSTGRDAADRCRGFPVHCPQTRVFGPLPLVITSYSIHYTKLYESGT